ncbi:plasmid stabilization protein [Candidatus Peregrinibacteria bacterium CG10_big_fil_rev_8_21_14_0_10_36_19]|nr:MAG: plasmid stabilization protein [Candidatus Peregrinibacteria bacterium CG10_big_fil_rev_8_21_14_0_10_36_19]
MKDYLKFLKRLPENLRIKVIKALEDLAINKTKGLDIKPINGEHQLYRCRVGKIRILFQKREEQNIILDIGFRGDIYKK